MVYFHDQICANLRPREKAKDHTKMPMIASVWNFDAVNLNDYTEDGKKQGKVTKQQF